MRSELAQHILQQVKNNYNLKAKEFSASRVYNWKEIQNLVDKYIKSGMSVLDVGCGNGRITDLFNNKQINYIGIDNSEILIEKANKKYGAKLENVKFIIGDILNLPFPKNKFDILICISVLHHIPSSKLRYQALQEMRRILKPSGILIMANWNLYQKNYRRYVYKYAAKKLLLQNKMDFGDIILKPFSERAKSKEDIMTGGRYHHAFTKYELKRIFRKIGFKIKECSYVKKGEKSNWREGSNLIIVGEKEAALEVCPAKTSLPIKKVYSLDNKKQNEAFEFGERA